MSTQKLAGRRQKIAAAEWAVARGEHPERPFVLLAQRSLFDDSGSVDTGPRRGNRGSGGNDDVP